MLDDLRGYLQLATGLTEVTANRAKEAAMSLVGQGFSLSTKAPDVVGQVQELADDLVSTSKTNRELLVSMIRSEVDKAVGRMGFVREDELAALRRHVQRLEQQIDELRTLPRPAGAGKAGSDVDLMVIGDAGLRALAPRLRQAAEQLGREINPVTMTAADFARDRTKKAFLRDVLANRKLFIKGNDHELARLG